MPSVHSFLADRDNPPKKEAPVPKPEITVKPYYHTGAISTPMMGNCTITVSRLTDTSAPDRFSPRFFGSVQCNGEEVHNCDHLDGNVAALLCHSWVVLHGFGVDCTCFPPHSFSKSEDC